MLVLPAPLFFAPSAELTHAMAGCDVIVYGEAHLVRASFQKGARDFLKEPWDENELLARATRRSRLRLQWTIGEERWTLDGARLVSPGGEVELTHQQSQVLAFLVERRGQLVSTVALEHELYPTEVRPTSRVLASVVSQLRAQLRAIAPNSTSAVVESIRGLGYRLP